MPINNLPPNLPPILPSNLPPRSSSNIPLTPSNMSVRPKRGTIFDKIDTKKIGEGSFFREGEYGGKRGIGLKAQLSALKRAGRYGETQNLSKENLGEFYDILSPHLEQHTKGYGSHISRRTARQMTLEAEALRKNPDKHFTKQDKKDFVKIVKKLREKDS